MNNAENLLKKIHDRKIIPKSKWIYILKNILFWSIWFVTVVLGGLSFAIIIFIMQEIGFELYLHFPDSKIEFIFSLLPVFWIVSLLIFSALAIITRKYCKKGYRYSVLVILGINILLSIVFGSIFYFTQGAEQFEKIFSEQISSYTSLEERKNYIWSQPENGLLAGHIISVNDSLLKIIDLTGEVWEIHFKDVLMRGQIQISINEKIKIIGTIKNNNIFEAKEIRPWNGNRNGDRNGDRNKRQEKN